MSNRDLKIILARTKNVHRTSWSGKLDDALWDYFAIFKYPIGMSSYKFVFGYGNHLFYLWELKMINLNRQVTAKNHVNQLFELDEF